MILKISKNSLEPADAEPGLLQESSAAHVATRVGLSGYRAAKMAGGVLGRARTVGEVPEPRVPSGPDLRPWFGVPLGARRIMAREFRWFHRRVRLECSEAAKTRWLGGSHGVSV